MKVMRQMSGGKGSGTCKKNNYGLENWPSSTLHQGGDCRETAKVHDEQCDVGCQLMAKGRNIWGYMHYKKPVFFMMSPKIVDVLLNINILDKEM
jgi:hypothetical protein